MDESVRVVKSRLLFIPYPLSPSALSTLPYIRLVVIRSISENLFKKTEDVSGTVPNTTKHKCPPTVGVHLGVHRVHPTVHSVPLASRLLAIPEHMPNEVRLCWDEFIRHRPRS